MKRISPEDYISSITLNEENVKYCIEKNGGKVNGTLLTNFRRVAIIAEDAERKHDC